MATTAPTSPAAVLPIGTWRVDPNAGELGFRARGVFGLVPVKGSFSDYDGELAVDEAGVRGELRINAATLDTGNTKRDAHLRAAAFFDVEQHPTVSFTLTHLTPSAGEQPLATGVLRIRDNDLKITTPLTVSVHDENHLHLSTEISVDRAAAGVGWSRIGMIQGKAHLRAHLILIPTN